MTTATAPVPGTRPGPARPADPPGADRHWAAERVVARAAFRANAAVAAVWGAVFGIMVISSVQGFASSYPTEASRRRLAELFGSDTGIRALLGPARGLATVGGFTAWRALSLGTLAGAIWGLLASTRTLRGGEDSGAYESLLAGPLSRLRGTAAQVLGLAGAWLVLLATASVGTVAAGWGPGHWGLSSSLYTGLCLSVGAGVFLAVGAVTAQLRAPRRAAASAAGALFGLAFLLRMVADTVPSLSWLRWTGPLGWTEELRPLTGSRPALLAAPLATMVLLGVAAVALAGRRDSGAPLAGRTRGAATVRLPAGPTWLSARLVAGISGGWLAALGLWALVVGLVASSASRAVTDSRSLERMMGRLAPGQGGAAYVGLSLGVLGTLAGVAAAGHLGHAREEEASGRLDLVLARPVGRRAWLAGRVALMVVFLAVLGVVMGLAVWLGTVWHGDAMGVGRLVEAGVADVAVALPPAALGVLALGAGLRRAALVTQAAVAWSFLSYMVVSALDLPAWLSRTSALHYLGSAPARPVDWAVVGWLALVSAGALGTGVALFGRRDLQPD